MGLHVGLKQDSIDHVRNQLPETLREFITPSRRYEVIERRQVDGRTQYCLCLGQDINSLIYVTEDQIIL